MATCSTNINSTPSGNSKQLITVRAATRDSYNTRTDIIKPANLPTFLVELEAE